MILPRKHLSINESILGFGAYLLEYMFEPISIDELWDRYKLSYEAKDYPIRFNFDQFIMTLDFLFMIDAIKLDEGGVLCVETHQPKS